MRTEEEVYAELNAVVATRPRTRWWPPMEGPQRTELEAWNAANPDAVKRIAELEAEAEAIAEEAKRQAKLAGRRNALLETGLGARTADVVMTGAAATPAIDSVREWLEGDKTWLMLTGDVGTGKTVAAGLAIQHALGSEAYALPPEEGHMRYLGPKGGSAAFRRASALVRMSAFDEGALELKHLKRVGLLVVDDLGTEHATSWGQSLIHEIFDTRHDDKRRTVITTNIKREQLKTALGDRLADRIAQDGKVVFLEGKSMRRVQP